MLDTKKPHNLNREATLFFLAVIATIKILYTFRHQPILHDYLSTIVAVILIYPALLYVEKRKIPIRFFEKSEEVISSLKLFTLTSAIIFPLFLGLSHLVLTHFLNLTFQPNSTGLSLTFCFSQIILVGFPEELFFRGYLQSFLKFRFDDQISFLKPLHLEATYSIPLSAIIFAASHSLIAFQWWHFSIFFPALVFGWLREKTNGLVAPILFHALSNIVITWIGASYR
ncbi:MAG: CPBP family intramembrane metalloprotease [Deltaproteobacteria bacterium]|nr:MAG: CPBP family intramembrane metalloprotease [Deltaproteobacteria bacterium]